MPSQEEIGICESADNLNQIFSYDTDLKSQFHYPIYHQNGLSKQLAQLNTDSSRSDNYSGHKTTHQLNSETVCLFSCSF